MPYCTECGHQNPAGARFCSNCGHRMPGDRPGDSTSTLNLGGPDRGDPEDEGRLTAEEQAAVEALPNGSALFVVQRGPSAGSRFLLDTDEVTAGRHPES